MYDAMFETMYVETMHTGSLIEDLMKAVERAEARPAEGLRQSFYVWDAASHEQVLEAQNSLAGVA
jgi:hypothetical protein